jgi:phosphatidylinositol alpha-1,6-mannosyltransferase
MQRPRFLRQMQKLGMLAGPLSSPKKKLRRRAIKVLWIAPSFFPRVGGLEVYNERIVESLANFCDVGLVTSAREWFPGDAQISHFTLSKLEATDATTKEQIARELGDIVCEFKPDLVHLGGAQVAHHRWAIPESIPVVATVHGNDLTLERLPAGVGDYLGRAEAVNTCAHVFAVSEHTAALCRQWGITAPLSIVTAGCDLEFFRPRPTLGRQARECLQVAEDVPIILTISRLVWGKGHLAILEAIRCLPFRVHWVVGGDGPFREQLMEAIAERGMADQVTLVGNVFDDDLLALYNACDLFVLAPEKRRFEDGRIYAESFGLVFLEASACGKPVITTRDCGCKDAVIDGGTGVLVPPSEPRHLSRAIEFVLSQPAVGKALGLGGFLFVHASGGWDRLASQTVERYEEILHPSRQVTEPPSLRIPL